MSGKKKLNSSIGKYKKNGKRIYIIDSYFRLSSQRFSINQI